MGFDALRAHARVTILPKAASRPDVIEAGSRYEQQFGIYFSNFAQFSRDVLDNLHSQISDELNRTAKYALIVSECSEKTLQEIFTLANERQISNSQRKRYLDIFLSIYRAMRLKPSDSVLTVAPRREGMLLAQELGLLSHGSLTPHMKRIPIQGGLAIGIESLPDSISPSVSGRIIDGAIASGATTICVMEMLSQFVDNFEIYTVHCTQESVNALFRYAAALGKGLTLNAGFVSGSLNKKFYAVADHDNSLVVVGDVGDMIAPILDK